MDFTRRAMMLSGLAASTWYLTGCASQADIQAARRPEPWWPQVSGPSQTGGRVQPLPPEPEPPVVQRTPATPGSTPTTATSTPAAATGSIQAIARNRWAGGTPDMNRIQPMGKVERITVHHEGWTEVNFDDAATTAKRLESIRKSHMERLGAGDIGYHFIIDRAGRLWQGRDLRYQGAHVRNQNPNNLGIMVLGNFDNQRPTQPQLDTLRSTLITLQRTYRVPVRNLFTHQELGPTECPGKALQAHMVTLRRTGLA